jgi:hypothetical protein
VNRTQTEHKQDKQTTKQQIELRTKARVGALEARFQVMEENMDIKLSSEQWNATTVGAPPQERQIVEEDEISVSSAPQERRAIGWRGCSKGYEY